MRRHPGVFMIECCNRRRGVMPGGVLLCSRCDFNHDGGTVVPNESQARDTPGNLRLWRVPPFGQV